MSKYEKQSKYVAGLADKGLINVRVIIPARSEPMLREWAFAERAALKEERENGQEPEEPILMSDYAADIPAK